MFEVYLIIYKTHKDGILFTTLNKSEEGYLKSLKDIADRGFIIEYKGKNWVLKWLLYTLYITEKRHAHMKKMTSPSMM